MKTTALDVLRFYLNRELSRLSGDSRSHDRSAIGALSSAIREVTELLEACKRIVAAPYGLALGDLEYLQRAIAKAEGRVDV